MTTDTCSICGRDRPEAVAYDAKQGVDILICEPCLFAPLRIRNLSWRRREDLPFGSEAYSEKTIERLRKALERISQDDSHAGDIAREALK